MMLRISSRPQAWNLGAVFALSPDPTGFIVSNHNRSQAKFGNGQVFSCQQCGQCCYGAGGIVLSPNDAARLAAHLGLQVAPFLEKYAEKVGGKQRLRIGDDGYCVFFGQGCRVHEAKPDVCRAWPFFKGNLEDADSLEMAKDYCPGIHPDASFKAFAAEGKAFLQREGLLRSDTEVEARALCLAPDKDSDLE